MNIAEKPGLTSGRDPYLRPKDAAALILVDRSDGTPKVLLGRRHANVIFHPDEFVFPGGRVEASDHRIPLAANFPKTLEDQLIAGPPAITSARARALAVAAIRETCEETGLCLGRKAPPGATPQAARLAGEWKPFAEAGLLPDPSSLFLVARAITPAGRKRRFDTRFFAADASSITHRVEGRVHADAELVELVWIPLGSDVLNGLHRVTRMVLRELDKRLADGPLCHVHGTPLFRFPPIRAIRT